MTVCSAPAHAGHWALTISGSGQATTNTGQKRPYIATGPVDIPIIVPQISAGDRTGPVFGGGTAPTIKANASLSVTVTGKWTADTNSDNTAPPGVMFGVSSTANADYNNNGGPTLPGTADDGYKDGPPPGSPVGTSGTPRVKYVAGSSTFAVTVTPSASASGTPGSAGGGGASASAGPIIITIHAQPYNFRSASFVDTNGVTHPAVVTDNPNATLKLSYLWSSTDGALADLTTCTFNENVTWDTNTVGSFGHFPPPDSRKVYAPPSPPAGTDAQGNPNAYLDPIIMGGAASDGGATDTFSPDTSYKGPYATTSWWGDQIYVFSDSATGEVNTPIPGPASGSNRITRTFAPTGTPSGTTGTLTISTRGNPAGPKSLK